MKFKGYQNDLSRLSIYQYGRAVVGVLALALYSFQVNASAIASDSAFQRFMVEASGVGKQTVNFGSNGTPVISPGVPTLSTNGSADLSVSRPGSFVNPAGNPVVGTAVAKVAKSSIGPIIAKAVNAWPVGALALGIGGAIYDVYQEMGYNLVPPASSGQLPTIVKNTVANTCPNTSYPVYPSVPYNPAEGFVYTPYCVKTNAASSTYTAGYGISNPAFGWGGVSFPCGNATCPTGTLNYGITSGRPAPVVSTVPSSQQEFIDAVAAKSGWPSTSRLAEAVAEAQKITNDTLFYDPASMTFTGPGTSTGRTSTTNNPDGSTTTSVTNYNHTYQGSNITTGATTTTTNNNPVTNVTTVTTTTTQPDTPDKTDCEKNPKALGCVDAEFDTPTGDIPKTTRNVTFAEENLGFGGGTCPADVVMTPHGMTQEIKMVNWAASCTYITTYAKPIILSLATFAALMIIFLGVKTE